MYRPRYPGVWGGPRLSPLDRNPHELSRRRVLVSDHALFIFVLYMFTIISYFVPWFTASTGVSDVQHGTA